MRIVGYRPSTSTVVAVGATTLALGGIAFAAIPDSNGVIRGCYHKSNGHLRVVDSASACKKSETAISWNQKGQPGQAGAPGTAGPPGPPGPPGNGTEVLRLRGDRDVAAVGEVPEVDYPLSNPTWTQQVGEIDQFYGGRAIVSLPGYEACDPDPRAEFATFKVRLFIPGTGVQAVDSVNLDPDMNERLVRVPRELSDPEDPRAPFFAHDVSEERTATVRIADNCTDQHLVVHSVLGYVLRFR